MYSPTVLEELLESIRATPACHLLPSAGRPRIREDVLPDDLVEFYDRCGGAVLFAESDYRLDVSQPSVLTPSNIEILGEAATGDISDHWYIIARSRHDQKFSIDLHRARLGRCYDSFWDRHGIVGSCPVVAESFTDLLGRALAARGGYWWWLEEGWASLGDAYDKISPQ